MDKIKTRAIDIEVALDNLAVLAAIDLNAPPLIGLLGRYRIVTSDEEGGVKWLSAEGSDVLLEVLDRSYEAILDELSARPWEQADRLSAIFALIGESAKILNRYLAYRLDRPLDQKVEDRPSYKGLQAFYKEHLQSEENAFLPAKGGGFKDFEAIKQDSEYELFYIRNEEGIPYFDAETLRSVKLTVDLESDEEGFEEDPLLKVQSIQDRDLHAAAGKILLECERFVGEFYRNYKKMEDNKLAQALSQAVIALLLANNPRYLLQNTTGKSCLYYFNDFLMFLRAAMQTAEYQKLIAYPPDKGNKISTGLLQFTHSLCRSLFCRPIGIQQEAIGLLHRSMRRGEELSRKKLIGDTLWNQFQIDDEKLRTLLGKFPNGPLFKVLDLIRLEQEEDTHIAFDPMGQDNLPYKLFSFALEGKKIDVLRIASPTKQAFIHKAEIIDEFRGFLRAIQEESRHLIVNLQSRDSWKEGVRCRILEGLQKRIEFASQLSVITLPKEGDFYFQTGAFAERESAEEFIAAFRSHLEHPEEHGFYFPQLEKTAVWDKLLHAVHSGFFHKKEKLTRENRQDFIEIVYQLIVLKMLEVVGANSMSFTCKDAIDTGPTASALFFGFLRLMTGDFSKKEEQDQLRFMLYTPALFHRERVTNIERVNRTLSCLEACDQELAERGKETLKELDAFMPTVKL